MQVYSLDEEHKLVPVHLAKPSINYFCPECGGPLRRRGGMHRRLHFYHVEAEAPCRLNGKSATHLAIQHYIQQLFSPEEVVIEKQFPSIARIADCYVPSKQCVFEIQCSFITLAEVKERLREYALLELQVVWILHDSQFNRFRKSAAEIFLQRHPCFYTNMNEWGQGCIYRDKMAVDLRLLSYKKSFIEKLMFRIKKIIAR